MLRRLKNGLTVAAQSLRPLSLYSIRSSADSESTTDVDSVHSDPTNTNTHDSDDDHVYSPVEFGPAQYEVALVTTRGQPQAGYGTDVQYCTSYDIYMEYGFRRLYEPVDYTSEVKFNKLTFPYFIKIG